MHVLNNLMNRAAVVQNKMLTLPARKYVRLSGRDSQMQRKMMLLMMILFKRPLTPPFYLNICPILQGVFFKRVFAGGVF